MALAILPWVTTEAVAESTRTNEVVAQPLFVESRFGPRRVDTGFPVTSNGPALRKPWSSQWIKPDFQGNDLVLLEPDSGKILWRGPKHSLVGNDLPEYIDGTTGGARWVAWVTDRSSMKSRLIVLDRKKSRLEWETLLNLSIGPSAISRDGQVLAFSEPSLGGASTVRSLYTPTIYFFDLEHRQQLATARLTGLPNKLPGNTVIEPLTPGRFAILAAGGLVFWDVPTGKALATHEFDHSPEHHRPAITADGKKLALRAYQKLAALGESRPVLRLYDADGRPATTLVLPADSPVINTVVFSPDKRYVTLAGKELEGGRRDVMGLWDTTGQRLVKFGDSDYISALYFSAYTASFSRDSKKLAVELEGNRLALYELPSGRLLQELPDVNRLTLSPDLNWVYRDVGNTLSVYSTHTGRAVEHLHMVGGGTLRWSNDSLALEIVTGAQVPKVVQRIALTFSPVTAIAEIAPGPARELRFTPDGDGLYTRYDKGAALWNWKLKKVLKSNQESGYEENTFFQPAREGWLGINRGQDQTRVMDMLSGRSILEFNSNHDLPPLQQVAVDSTTGEYHVLTDLGFDHYGPDGVRLRSSKPPGFGPGIIAARNSRLALLSNDRMVRVWQLAKHSGGATNQEVLLYQIQLPTARLDPACTPYYRLTLSYEGRYLHVTAPECGQREDLPKSDAVYNLKTGLIVTSGKLAAPQATQRNRAVTYDVLGRRLQVWDFEQKKIVAIFTLRSETPAPQQIAVAISADGRRVAGATNEGFVRVWDVDTGIPLGELQGSAPVTALGLDSTGRHRDRHRG